MAIKVYSAAKATFPLKGQSKQEAWATLTEMFRNTSDRAKYLLTSFRQRVEPVNVTKPGEINLGDLFEYRTFQAGSEMHLNITHAEPFNSFTFVEGYSDAETARSKAKGNEPGKNQMQVTLADGSEATQVTIVRRKLGEVSLKDRLSGVANHAQANLQYILTGSHWGKKETQRDDMIIFRDDTLCRTPDF